MYLIVGLGNPGSKYEHTRHNVGFDVLTLLSEKLKIPITHTHCAALVGEGMFEGEKIALCKPQTYMNLSGEAVGALLRWYKLPPERMIVIYDDVDLAPGWLRIRANGSAGTHNGMRSIVGCIDTEAFPRIRIGTGGKPPAFDLADWVLSRYATPEERKTAFDAYTLAADAALDWMRNGIASAMNRYNTKKPKPPKPEKEAQAADSRPETKASSVKPEMKVAKLKPEATAMNEKSETTAPYAKPEQPAAQAASASPEAPHSASQPEPPYTAGGHE